LDEALARRAVALARLCERVGSGRRSLGGTGRRRRGGGLARDLGQLVVPLLALLERQRAEVVHRGEAQLARAVGARTLEALARGLALVRAGVHHAARVLERRALAARASGGQLFAERQRLV